MNIANLVTEILTDLGDQTDGTGFWTLADVLTVMSHIQQEISAECGNVIVNTPSLTVTQALTEIEFETNGLATSILNIWKTLSGVTTEVNAYTMSQIREGMGNVWQEDTGGELVGLIVDAGRIGTFRPYPVMTDSNTSVVIRFRKLAQEISTSTEITEAGDAANQLSAWSLAGIRFDNTDNYRLYWELSNVATTRTVKLYKNSAKTAASLVAQGSRTGDGSITLTAQNSSGLSGSVTVAFTIDDTDSANILTLAVLEIPQVDRQVLKNGIKALLLEMERDGKNASKGVLYRKLYESGKEAIKSKTEQQNTGTYRTINERGGRPMIWPTPYDYKIS